MYLSIIYPIIHINSNNDPSGFSGCLVQRSLRGRLEAPAKTCISIIYSYPLYMLYAYSHIDAHIYIYIYIYIIHTYIYTHIHIYIYTHLLVTHIWRPKINTSERKDSGIWMNPLNPLKSHDVCWISLVLIDLSFIHIHPSHVCDIRWYKYASYISMLCFYGPN